jgi:hypothetical protein
MIVGDLPQREAVDASIPAERRNPVNTPQSAPMQRAGRPVYGNQLAISALPLSLALDVGSVRIKGGRNRSHAATETHESPGSKEVSRSWGGMTR